MKSILIAAAILVLGGVGTYVYVTRPVPAPSALTADTTTNDTTNKKVAADAEIRTINMGIISSESTATFKLNEILRGTPTVVIGKTNTLSGDVSITFAPANITLGEIKINARTLKTDNEQRNGAISRMILHSDQAANEFITFKNSVVTGLPTEIPKGQKFNFTVTGDLTIAGTTKKITFNASGTVGMDNSFTGSASTIIKHADFGIQIPDFPFLANVDKQSQIDIAFVAR